LMSSDNWEDGNRKRVGKVFVASSYCDIAIYLCAHKGSALCGSTTLATVS